MNGFWDLERTNEGTDERKRNHRSPTPVAGDQKLAIRHQQIGRKWPKTYFVTTSNVFLNKKTSKKAKKEFSQIKSYFFKINKIHPFLLKNEVKPIW